MDFIFIIFNESEFQQQIDVSSKISEKKIRKFQNFFPIPFSKCFKKSKVFFCFCKFWSSLWKVISSDFASSITSEKSTDVDANNMNHERLSSMSIDMILYNNLLLSTLLVCSLQTKVFFEPWIACFEIQQFQYTLRRIFRKMLVKSLHKNLRKSFFSSGRPLTSWA